ncbi:MAG: DoxX family protein [Chitinophagaceae bacterium]
MTHQHIYLTLQYTSAYTLVVYLPNHGNQQRHIFDQGSHVLAFLISWIHLLRGLFIHTGLITRWAALAQLPILIGKVFFVNANGGVRFCNTELLLSIVLLILVVVFIIKGSGTLTADEYFRSYYKAGSENGATRKLFQ